MNQLRIVLIFALVLLLAAFVSVPFLDKGDDVAGAVVPESSPTPVELTPPPSMPAISPAGAPAAAPLPQQVTLLRSVVFPVARKGQPTGQVRAQSGVIVELVEDRGTDVVVRLVDSLVSLPRSAVTAPLAAMDNVPDAGVTGQVLAVKQRVLDYWFPAALGR